MPVNISFTTEQFCSICLETYNESTGHDAVRLGCQHAFGRQCIQAWASQSTKCPTCRSNFSPASLRADKNIPQSLADRLDRLVVTLCENRSAVYFGLKISWITCSCIAAFAIDSEFLTLPFMVVMGYLFVRRLPVPA